MPKREGLPRVHVKMEFREEPGGGTIADLRLESLDDSIYAPLLRLLHELKREMEEPPLLPPAE